MEAINATPRQKYRTILTPVHNTGGFHVTSSPLCWWTKTKDLSLAPFVCPPEVVHFSIVIGVSRCWLKTSYCVKALLKLPGRKLYYSTFVFVFLADKNEKESHLIFVPLKAQSINSFILRCVRNMSIVSHRTVFLWVYNFVLFYGPI